MKEVIKQFRGGVYKFKICDFKNLRENTVCNKIHIYEKRFLGHGKYRWFYIGDLDDTNTSTFNVEQHSGDTPELPDDERTGVPPRHRRGGNWF